MGVSTFLSSLFETILISMISLLCNVGTQYIQDGGDTHHFVAAMLHKEPSVGQINQRHNLDN